MKKVKIAPVFHFKEQSKEDMIESLNAEFPLNLKDLAPLVDRIHEKYPYIDKSEISLIVKATFESIREFLVLGYVINFNKFLFDMKLHFYRIKEKIGVKVKAKTPPKFKEGPYV